MSRISSSSSASNISVNPEGFASLGSGYPKQVSVIDTGSSEILPANPDRKYAHIFNNSGQPIFIQYLAAAAVGAGIRIPNNTLYTLESNNLWLGSINAIGVNGSQLIDVLEGE